LYKKKRYKPLKQQFSVMAQFRFETEVQTTVTLEYFIEADTLEEALEQLREGEVRGEGLIIEDDTDWGTEVITVEETI
jgi:muramidase (phage lysozyme)